MSKPVLAVAIDFGTTFSGLTYMQVGRNEMLGHLNNWPGARGQFNKVPTIISYELDTRQKWVPKAFGFAAESAPAGQRCSMFKMCWDEEEDEGVEPEPWQTWVRLGKSVAEVVKDYVQLLYEHMLSTFIDQGLSPENITYNVLFTVPAQFEVLEVERFKSIVSSTGFGKHTMSVSLREPEAAILYTINHGMKPLMPAGQCIVLCDAGGGTVDIASYKVTELYPKVKIEQVDIVNGAPCGSVIIDRNFKNFLYRECIDEHWRPFFQKAEGLAHLHLMCQSFTNRKEVFNNSPNVEYITLSVSPPNLTGPKIDNGILKFPRSKMCELFEESVSGTITCLDRHVRRCLAEGFLIKSIFLVGGLGSSKYLHSKVKEYATEMSSTIEVIQPIEYAVIRGAIETHQQSLLGFDEQIAVKLCPASYGVRCNKPWDNRRNDKKLDDQYTNPHTKKVMALNQVSWLIKKGDKITGKKMAEIKENFSRNFKKSPEIWADSIVMCNLDNPPSRMTEDVKEICTLKSDMTGLPLDIFDKQKSPNSTFLKRKKFYRCDFDIVVKIGLTDIEFALWFKDKLRSDLLKIAWSERG
ncbi:hypothetical protein H072_1154 [Dactylellina haptotyla CBS 200.50]|uniref:Actin-like ATPase domain-containing protein n=1 Tax=Dactylellina haptotyla (strain CBS 200.50) TaxID=1284197 RepID=S8CAY8_DACHA|nr:hypothetical protein H072_1154 [Dactylellina haptotyla CBS 200.50]